MYVYIFFMASLYSARAFTGTRIYSVRSFSGFPYIPGESALFVWRLSN